MIIISKLESQEIAKRFPDVSIVRTMKGDSKRGHYYLEERRDVMAFLKEYRYKNVIEEHPARRERSSPKKKPYWKKDSRRGDQKSLHTKK